VGAVPVRESVVVVYKEGASERKAASECPVTATSPPPPFSENSMTSFVSCTELCFSFQNHKKINETGPTVRPVSKQVRESEGKQRTLHWAPEGRQLASED